MRFDITLLLFAACSSSTLAKPLPSDFNDIERRWSEGQSEAQIHAAHSIREATPAWPVARAAGVDFDSTTDERTMLERKREDAGLIQRMRTFVHNYMVAKGKAGVVEARDEVPVLKPRKGMRYRFTA
ncbi:hypothetical protein KC332_g4979 [Hortaea werneckii]|uniref:Uncharacterized protein n=2 Tax=Hortaea werneckii TaxID=91943 RepID=A0A3M7IAU1_HORWE|nr:hypothetical protein KC358_g12210 [Hortaea werneckii]OTA23767.1 hypothetical protein BTJ68_13750 [Hortaea werneckii EXF-2000]KAI6823232.1 hypothetical protein KC350_g9267 [Hortaea werneckii]KAI6921201.1 hypothetical protein KC348_g10216 [Hortaea werneckii]KAI6931148.1 hypothetical protein KC341_g9781 [Hortaea werneckii]